MPLPLRSNGRRHEIVGLDGDSAGARDASTFSTGAIEQMATKDRRIMQHQIPVGDTMFGNLQNNLGCALTVVRGQNGIASCLQSFSKGNGMTENPITKGRSLVLAVFCVGLVIVIVANWPYFTADTESPAVHRLAIASAETAVPDPFAIVSAPEDVAPVPEDQFAPAATHLDQERKAPASLPNVSFERDVPSQEVVDPDLPERSGSPDNASDIDATAPRVPRQKVPSATERAVLRPRVVAPSRVPTSRVSYSPNFETRKSVVQIRPEIPRASRIADSDEIPAVSDFWNSHLIPRKTLVAAVSPAPTIASIKEPQKREFDLTFLPPGAAMFVASRPAELSNIGGLEPMVDMMKDDNRAFGDISQWIHVYKHAGQGSLLEYGNIYQATSTAGFSISEFGMPLERVEKKFGDATYFTARDGSSFYATDETLVLCRNEPSLRSMISASRSPHDAPNWMNGWDRVQNAQFAAAIDISRLGNVLDSRGDSALMKQLKPLLRRTKAVVAGVNLKRQVELEIILTSANTKDAQDAALILDFGLEFMVDVVAGMKNTFQKSNDPQREALVAATDAAEKLLRNAKLERNRNTITIRSAASIDVKNLIEQLLPIYLESRKLARARK